MVQAETSSVTTRLQARVDAHEEKIQHLSNEVKELSATVFSMKDILQGLPNTIEKMMMSLLKQQGKLPPPEFDDDGSLHHEGEDSGSGPKPDNLIFSLPKVELPLFDGHDPRGWITKAELYFQVHHTLDLHKLHLVQMCMDEVALNWFTTLLYKHPQTSWDQFRSKLMLRFSGTRFLNAHEALGSLYQEGAVDDYINQFEALSALIPNLSEDQSLGMFLRGLQHDIRNWVRTLNPATCDEAMDSSRLVEVAIRTIDRSTVEDGFTVQLHDSNEAQPTRKYLNELGPKFNRATPIDPQVMPNNTRAHHLYPAGGLPRPPDNAQPRYTGTRHLTKQEWEDRRRKGLCFGCGQRYSPQHKCAEGQLRIMLMAEGDWVGDDGVLYQFDAPRDAEA